MTKRKHTDVLIVHCADTPPGMDLTVDMIDRWHKAKGWDGIGYHYLVKADGNVLEGRQEDEVGAHVKGFNSVSVGICLEGGHGSRFDFTRVQMDALGYLLSGLLLKYKKAVVRGHNDYDPHKTCPNFDAKRWWYGS